MEIILLIIIGYGIWYYFLVLRPGRLDFWRVVSKNPDSAFHFFSSQDCWKIFENGLPDNYKSIIPKKDWVGPFRLWVPSLGNKMVFIFGRVPDYEESQNEFLKILNKGKTKE